LPAAIGWQEFRLIDLIAVLGKDPFAKDRVFSQSLFSGPLAFGLPVLFQHFEPFTDDQLATVEANARAIETHDPLELGLRQGRGDDVQRDRVVLLTDVAKKCGELFGSLLLGLECGLFFGTLIGGVLRSAGREFPLDRRLSIPPGLLGSFALSLGFAAVSLSLDTAIKLLLRQRDRGRRILSGRLRRSL
jgi:hypothetical protein